MTNNIKEPKKIVKRPITLEKFGMRHDAEWMLVVPSRYDDYATITGNYKDLVIGNIAVIEGELIHKKLTNDQNQECNFKVASRLSIKIRNSSGQVVTGSAFGRPGFAWNLRKVGEFLTYRGKVKQGWNGYMDLSMIEVVPDDLKGKIVPIYPNIKVTKGQKFREKIDEHFHLLKTTAAFVKTHTGWGDSAELVDVGDVTGFDSPLELLLTLHKPKSVQDGEHARRAARIISGISLIRNTLMRANSIPNDLDAAIPINFDDVKQLKSRLPFKITNDQNSAIDGISNSLKSNLPMSGLLSGDVGSGKTVSFLIPLIATYLAGKTAVLMTPNLLLIEQVKKEINTIYPEIPVCTLTGKNGINGDPSNSVIIGNTALIGAYKKGKIKNRPNFLVIDEQHKFSVEQRQAIAVEYTNVIEATATPIPRTAALVTHGTADVYLLREIPVQKTIRTRILTRHEARMARDAIMSSIGRGEQAAVVYPLVESDTPEKSRSTVTDAYGSWSRHIDPSLIAILHGKMSDEEKSSVLDSFRSGAKRLLLASTVIEVGITLPELKTMMVVDSDRFGVVTLHQLRGRLARHGGIGDMILFANSPSEDAVERLGLLVDHTDGFILAEKDAEQRGYGDLVGNDGDAQSGKTRTLFLGVNVGPGEISFAANLYENAKTK